MKRKTEAKRQEILKVAADTFREFGFERTSISVISARLGGSKATLYNYFTSKEELFFETVSLSMEAEFEAAYSAIDSKIENIAESLRHFGESWLACIYSPQILAQRRLAITASSHTELRRIMYERGVLRGQKIVSEYLHEAMHLGRLRQADPVVATRHLLSLLESELIECVLYRISDEVSVRKIKTVTGRAIEVFMAAYGLHRNRL